MPKLANEIISNMKNAVEQDFFALRPTTGGYIRASRMFDAETIQEIGKHVANIIIAHSMCKRDLLLFSASGWFALEEA